MHEINKEIEFETKARDDICRQIVEMDKILSKIDPMVDNLRKTNSELKEEICVVQRKFEIEESAIKDATASFQDLSANQNHVVLEC